MQFLPPPGGRGLFYFFVGYYWLLRMPLVTLFPIERMWSRRDAISTGNITLTALPRLQYFRCLLNRRGVQAAPVTNKYARRPPTGAGSCYEQWFLNCEIRWLDLFQAASNELSSNSTLFPIRIVGKSGCGFNTIPIGGV